MQNKIRKMTLKQFVSEFDEEISHTAGVLWREDDEDQFATKADAYKAAINWTLEEYVDEIEIVDGD